VAPTILHQMVSQMKINTLRKIILIANMFISQCLFPDFFDEGFGSQGEETKSHQEKIIKSTPFGTFEHEKKAKIPFSSKKAKISKKNGSIELIGNASIEQAKLNLKANHITISLNMEKGIKKNSIKSFKAAGNVRISKNLDGQDSAINAKAMKLLYVIDDNEILLEGNALVQKKDETIQGQEILINSKTGHVKILSAKGLLERGISSK